MGQWKAALILALLIVPTNAYAAVVLKSYTVDFSFTTGPVTSLQQTFTLSYDPTILTGTGPGDPIGPYEVGSYSSSSNLPTFLGTIFAGMNDTNGVSLYFSKLPKTGVQINTDDFSTRISVDSNGDLTSSISDILFSTVGSTRFYGARGTVVQNAVTASVPEPSTWTITIAGFGLLGASLRRRRYQEHRAAGLSSCV